MVAMTLVLAERVFIAFGLVHGSDEYMRPEFKDARVARLQAMGLCAYFYVDTMEEFQRRALEVTNAKIEVFNKGYLLGRSDVTGGNQVGRA